MAVVDTVRPNATIDAVGWTIQGGAASHQAAQSDDNDATYSRHTVVGSNIDIRMRFAGHSPPADHQRHRARLRIRARQDSDAGAGFLTLQMALADPTGIIVQSYQLEAFDENPSTRAAPYSSAAELQLSSGSAIQLRSQVNEYTPATTDEARLLEQYVDVDCRAKPTFVADVLDGAGTSQNGGTITDTSRAELVFGTPAYDGLASRSWTLEVRTDPGGIIVYQASGNGTPPASITTDALANGDYEADLQIFSTVRINDAFASDVETVTFTVAFVAPASPDLTATPNAEPPSVELDWITGAPTGTTWDDNDEVVTEIRRTDCNGTSTIYVAQTGLGAQSQLDRFMSLSTEGVLCGEEDHVCEVCYEARYWGRVDQILVTSEWSSPECVTSVPNPTPGDDWIHGAVSGDLSICPDRSWNRARPFGAFQPIGGGLPTVITGTPGGRDYTLAITVDSYDKLEALEAIIGQQLVYYQPTGLRDQWMAAEPETVSVTKVGRVSIYQVSFIEVEAQPQPDPLSFFAG